MNSIKSDMKAIQGITFEAYKTSGALMALLDSRGADPDAVADALEKMSAQYENGVIALRDICEKHHPGVRKAGPKPALPHISLAGRAEVNEYGWLHIELNALLPNCRFQTPAYLSDTITRLLDEYEARGRLLPRFEEAILIIDEHCDIGSRMVYDQDNKGWKAVPNVLKNRVIKDDDQFSLSVALISTRSKNTACHIYVLPQGETGDFFCLRNDCCPAFI